MKINLVARSGQASEDVKRLLVELQNATFQAVYVGSGAMDQSHWWLAREGDEVAGFAGLTIYANEPTGFLCLSGVLPAYRGQRLQRRFISERVKYAKAAGCRRVISYTSLDNVWSANNLFAGGFRLYVPRWAWGCKQAMYFERKL